MPNMVEGGGFEPPKSKQQIYSLPPLAAREPLQNWKPHILLEPTMTVNKKRPESCRDWGRKTVIDGFVALFAQNRLKMVPAERIERSTY